MRVTEEGWASPVVVAGYQLGLQSSEHSPEPDVRESSLTGLAVAAGRGLEAQLGLSAGTPTRGPRHVALAFHSLTAVF